jgi:uncharacterized membrane protein YgcG
MRPRLGHVLVLGALVFVLVAGAMAQDLSAPVDSDARIVRLSYVDGSVQMDRDDLGTSAAYLNSPVTGGARLSTASDGFAEVEFETGGTLRVTPNSNVLFRQLGLRDGNKVTLIEMTDGTGYFNIKKDSDDDFRVVVGGNELRVPKSSRFRIHLQPQSAQIAVMKGELELVGPDGDVKIKKDEQLLLDFQDPGRYFLGRTIDALDYDSWDHDRDDYRAQYANASTSYSGYSSNYSYGVSDLNYYGSYVNVAGYGSMWRPYGYDVGWDPFMDGAWVWYPGWGYMWVSSYPWGWMPYRYGRWVWVAGYGWMWQPGNSWNRWYVCNTVYNPPHYYHPPHRPNTPVVIGHQVGGGVGSGHPPIIVGKFPTGEDRRRFLNPDGGDVQRMRGRQPVTAQAPPVITPGVQPPHVVDELRRLHGDNLGVHGKPVVTTSTGGQANADTSAAAPTGTINTGVTTNTGMGNPQPSPRIMTGSPAQSRGEREVVADPHPTPVQTVHPEPRLQVTPTPQQHVTPPPEHKTPPPPASTPQTNSYQSSGSSYHPSSNSGSSANSYHPSSNTGSSGSSYHPSSSSSGSSSHPSSGSSSGSSHNASGNSSSGSHNSSASSSHDNPK